MLVLLAAVLVGIDLYLSYRRMKTYGPVVELNPLARQLAQDYGIMAGMAWLALSNGAILSILDHYSLIKLLYLLVGAKLALVAMQLKSLQIELMVEKLLRKK